MSRIGPSTTVAFGHEWMSNTFIWGISMGKLERYLTLNMDLFLPTFYTTLNLVLPSSVFSLLVSRTDRA